MLPSEIEAQLRDENSGLREKIMRDIGSSTVALVRAVRSGEPGGATLGGTGSLVAIEDSHYILTAAHVWQKFVAKGIEGVGLTLRENEEHQFVLERKMIAASPVPNVGIWGKEWGSDLTLLRIPPEYRGDIERSKVFRNLTMKPLEPPAEPLQLCVLMGAPEVDVDFSEGIPDMRINAFFCHVSARHTRENFDYLDLEMDLTFPGIPENFGGVTGGGLWRALVYGLPNGKIDWQLSPPMGVAFYQSPPENNERIIRCHGPESIRIAAAAVTVKN